MTVATPDALALQVQGLSRAFGGVRAIDALSFDVKAGHVHAIIGPNGAGKTTLINLITGIYTPDSGRIRMFGEDVTGRSPEQLARAGLSRTFQNLQVCMNMSAVDNVMVGAHLALDTRLLAGILRLPSLRRADAACRERAMELLSFVGIDGSAHALASDLSYGVLKRLEIARAMAAKPQLVLLDEPAAGLNHTETSGIEHLIRRLADDGTTVILVEHDMKLVMGVSDRILVLHHGQHLAEGSVQDVRNDPRVIAAYLGAAA
jgi:branched-chain amino acid transport system ATP-binding protein